MRIGRLPVTAGKEHCETEPLAEMAKPNWRLQSFVDKWESA
ncbi:hypothetical protein JCM19237_2834 [Photobacterium aphoticum]|uniref:Uncharacterized protein n=1 Tax=Photobacterium aphoticum TaxID=754436 RepID=A0A090QYJ5_9GAMM|nr:hypothetical protein JCM19237_2834 [Photobacterium aphoticum]